MSTSADRMRALRERRAALLSPAPDAAPAAAPELSPAVESAISALGLGPQDAAAAQLARSYAATVDQAADPALALKAFGPLLLKALEALKATPAARPPKAPPGRQGPNKVAALRAEFAARQRRRGA